MVVDERSRHQLYRRLEEVLGAEAATTLIEHLPPVGWADVATKHDLAGLEERIELRFARVDDRFNMMEERFTGLEERLHERFAGLEERSELRFARVDVRFDGMDHRITAAASALRATFEHELRSQTTTMMFGMVSVVLTMAALTFALVRFT